MKRIIFFAFAFSIFHNIAIAQLTSPENNEKPYIPSWDTYEFMKYGDVGASLYTGTVNYSIPIYEYGDGDFQYIISVSYATNGFRVNHPSGLLGHGWALDFPGMITREIHGLADESAKTVIAEDGNGCQLFGYDKTPIGNLKGCVLVNGNGGQAYTAMVDGKGNFYDAQPDIYRFNFCGYNGSFRKIPSEAGHSFLLFDCDSKSQSLKIESFTYNEIILIDGLGYKYAFSVGEYTKETYSEAVNPLYENRIRQWNLNRITASNGRTIEFEYRPIADNGGLDKSEHNVSYMPTSTYAFSYYAGIDEGYGSKSIGIYESDNYSTRLVGIKFADGTHARIEYSDGIKELRYTYPNGETREALGENKKIESILIYSSDGKPFRKATFSYLTVGGNSSNENNLTFLKSIDISGQGCFCFEYNPMASYPPLGTVKRDHWGYYNGESGGFATENFLSNLIYDNDYNEIYTSNFKRSPDFQSALSGTLSKIVYPTGGFSTITYEQHDCSHKVTRTNSTLFLPQLMSLAKNENVGGVRVKQVSTFLSDGTSVDTVRYEYFADESKGLSSGILINAPRYGIKYVTDNNKAVERFNLFNSIFDFTHTHIEYSHVREYKSSAGYADYYYSTYQDYPDEYQLQEEEDKDNRKQLFGYYSNGTNYGKISFCNPSHLVTNLLTPFASVQTKRGLITAIKRYNSDGCQVSETKYNYQFPLVKTDTILTLAGEIARDVFYPRHNIELSSVEENILFDNTVISTKRTSVYNSYGMETKTECTESNGNITIDTYRYIGDETNTDDIIGKMKNAHCVNNIILHEKKVKVDGEECLIGKTRYSYYCPDDKNSRLFKVANFENWTPSRGWSIGESYGHDKLGRVIEKVDTNGVPTSYLWGYKGRYRLAIARNVSIAQLEQSLASQGLTSYVLANTTDYDNQVFDKLSIVANKFHNSLVEIFKFKPNIGLIEHASPNSLRTYYNYDGYCRMVSVSDQRLNTMEQIAYDLVSIKPLSAELTCGESYVDEPLNIKVTADGGTHSYRFMFKFYKAKAESPVYEIESANCLLDIIPKGKELTSGNYRVQCEVADGISGEKVLLDKDICIKPAKLCFSDISQQFTKVGDNEIYTAKIYTDTPTSVTFGLDLVSSAVCTVSIAEKPITTKREKESEFVVQLQQGNNNVTFSIPSSTSLFEADLWIKEATDGHEIGNPSSMTVIY